MPPKGCWGLVIVVKQLCSVVINLIHREKRTIAYCKMHEWHANIHDAI